MWLRSYVTYLCCKCWHVFLWSFCLTTSGLQGKGPHLESVSCRGGHLTRNIVLTLHRLPQVWPCCKCEKLYIHCRVFLDVCHVSLIDILSLQAMLQNCTRAWGLHRASWSQGCSVRSKWGTAGRNTLCIGDLSWSMGEVASGEYEEPVWRRNTWKRSGKKERGTGKSGEAGDGV